MPRPDCPEDISPSAWDGYCETFGDHYATEEHFKQAYMGYFNTKRVFGEEYAERHGHEVPRWLGPHVDWESYADSLEGVTITDAVPAGVHVFDDNA